ncbi:MAG: hypothetical protein GX205_02490 [Firmicutes bacterium]|nr:hypothetical protein [Bacillota bacterium]
MRRIGIVIVAVLLAFGGYLYQQNRSLVEQVAELRSELVKQDAEQTAEPQSAVTIYLVEETPTDFLLVPVKRYTSGQVTPQRALELLIQGPAAGENYRPAVSPRTEVLSLTVEEGLATVSFSSALKEDYVGGSQNESNLVNAIVHTLTQFPEIERVQILIEGAVIESIGGHIAINRPLAPQREQ